MKLSESRKSFFESAQVVATYLVREPVKAAVRDALREERVPVERDESPVAADPDEGGSSMFLLAVGAVAIAAALYALRRTDRTEIGWSSDPESGLTRDRDGAESTGTPGRATDDEADDRSSTGSRLGNPGSTATGGGMGTTGGSTRDDSDEA